MKLKQLLTGRLDRETYLTGLNNFPIPTVDFVVVRGDKFLLIKRNEGAFLNEWFVAGGRQNRGETQEEALLRIASRELGLKQNDIINFSFTGCQDVFNPESPTSEGGVPDWHSIWHFYLINVVDTFEPTLDATSDTYIWVKDLSDTTVSEPVSRALKMAKLI